MDSLESLIKSMEQTGADEIKQEFAAEKDGKEYLFEIKLTRKHTENDNFVD